MTVTVATFYKFVAVPDRERLRDAVRARCEEGAITGTVLIAGEGINATVAGGKDEIAGFLSWLRADARFADLAVKEAAAPAHPFRHLKVKIKPEIVALGVGGADPAARTGTRVRPADWNALIGEPGVVVLDARNAYEIAIGTFAGAVDPGLASFGAFPEFAAATLDPAEHPRIAMFCTGGIRCEKASAHLLSKGFTDVRQLDGGILAYLAQVPPEQSLWRGECFVFDERVAVGHAQAPGTHVLCPQTGRPVKRG